MADTPRNGRREVLPSFQLYPSDFASSPKFRRMTLEERGAYLTLLLDSWMDRGLEPDSIADRLGVEPEDAARLMAGALGRCFELRGGRLVNPRQERERRVVEDFRAKMSEAGKRSGKARSSGNQAEPTLNQVQPTLNQVQPSSTYPEPGPTPIPSHPIPSQRERAREVPAEPDPDPGPSDPARFSPFVDAMTLRLISSRVGGGGLDARKQYPIGDRVAQALALVHAAYPELRDEAQGRLGAIFEQKLANHDPQDRKAIAHLNGWLMGESGSDLLPTLRNGLGVSQ